MELKEYVRIIQKRLWIVIVTVFVCSSLAAGYSYFVVHPIYEASARLIVNKGTELEGLSRIDTNAIDTNIKLLNTYKEIILSTAIMGKVAEQYPELGYKPKELIERVEVEKIAETQVLRLSLQDESYERAVNTVNAVSKVFQAQVTSIMKVDNVTILNPASWEDVPSPVKPNKILIVVVSLFASLMLSLGLVFFLDYLDDSIDTEEELLAAAGIPTLAVIPVLGKGETASSRTNNSQNITGGPSYAANR